MISILLAVHNGEKYLRQSIDSVISQTSKSWELLIGFNGTSDSSKNIAKEYNEPRIKLFDYGKDKGKAKTLNKLIKEAKYDWCAIQDDDDLWEKQKLEKQIKHKKDYDVIGSFIKYIDEKGFIIGGPNLASNHEDIKARSLSGVNQVANLSAIFKKSAVYSIGGWDENIDGIEDYDLWLRLLRCNYKFFNVPEYLCFHRLHKESNFNTKKQDVSKIL
jgi:glycosyltransferase involved in cell wall biosynthesis